jgi:MSHA biogenesis protein MshQ
MKTMTRHDRQFGDQRLTGPAMSRDRRCRRLGTAILIMLVFAPAAWSAVTLRGATQNAVAGASPSAISYVGAGAPASLNTCGSINAAIQSGATGDILIATVITKESDTSVSMSGWNSYYSATYPTPTNNNQELQAYIFWRIATGGDPNTVTQSGTCDNMAVQVARFSGVDTSSPFETSTPGVVAQDSNAVDSGPITTTSPTAMLLVAAFISDNRTLTPAAGWIQSFNFALDPGGFKGDLGLSLHYQAQTTAGSKSTSNWALSGGGSDENFGVMLALRPAFPSLPLAVPAGTTTDDVLIAAVAVSPSTLSITPPAGWTSLNRVDQAAGNSNSQEVFYRIATAAEPASYTWTFSGATGGAAGGMLSYSGVDTSAIFDANGGNITPSGTSHTASSITTTVTDALLVSIHSYSSSDTWTPPTGMTEEVDVASLPTPNPAGIALEMNDVTQATAGASGDKTATATGNADTGVAQLLALTPLTAASVAVAEYRMDESAWNGTAGEVTDQTGNLPGTALNGVTTDGVNPAVAGDPGTCRYGTFDGVDDYIQVNNLSGVLNSTASLAFWINTNQIGNNTGSLAPGVTGVEQAAGTDDILWGWLDGSGHIGISVGNDYTTKSVTAINNGSWHHVVLTRNAASGAYKIYIDGVLNASGSIAAGTIGTAFASLGRIEDTGGSPEYFNGQLDEVRVYPAVLTDAQVTTVMNETHPCVSVANRMEAASVTLNDTTATPAFSSVTFNQTYTTTPLVFLLPTNDGADPASLRIRNVTTTGFQVAQVEPQPQDGPHPAMTVAYLAIEPGTLTLPDGRVLEAGSVSTTNVQHGISVPGAKGWDTVNFTTAFAGTPAVLAQVQSMNNEGANPPATASVPWLTAAVRNITGAGMQVALERSEVDDGGTVTANETIGYLAVEGGVQGSFVSGSATILYESLVPTNITGWDNNSCAGDVGVAVNFVNTYALPPLVIASQDSHSDLDGGWLRRCGPVAVNLVRLAVDEDQFRDSERGHSAESAGVLAISEPFCLPACTVAVLDHYNISHAGTGMTCLSEAVTITAVDTDGNPVDPGNVTINLSVAPVSGDAVIPPAKGDWVRVAAGTGTLSNSVNNGTADYTFPGDGTSSVTLIFNYTRFETGNTTETINFNVADVTYGVTDTRNSDSVTDPDMVFSLAGFQFYNETAGNTVIPDQIAGKPSGTAPNNAVIGLRALRVSDNDATVCVSAFPDMSTVTVPLGAECLNPGSCAGRQLTVTNNSVTSAVATSADNGGAGAAAYTGVNLLFQDDGSGITRALLQLAYPDVGQMQLHASYEIPLDQGGTPPTGPGSGGFMSGSSNPFVVKPFGFAIGPVQDAGGAANPGADTPGGALFASAGTDFRATVTAYNWDAADDDGSTCDPASDPGCLANDGIPDTNANLLDNNGGGAAAVTPNYQGSGAVAVTLTPVAPYEPDAGIGGTLGQLLDSTTGAVPVIAATDFSGGSATTATLQYLEAGSMTLKADATNYLGAGPVSGRSSNLGSNPNNGVVGRFGADHFIFTANTPQLGPACGTFTYVDQPFTYTTAPQITAKAVAADGATVLTNYEDFSAAGGADWWLLNRAPVSGGGGVNMAYTDLAVPTDIQLDSTVASYTPNSGTTGSNGQQLFSLDGPLAYAKKAPPISPQPPFNGSLRLDFTVTDSDGATGTYTINPVMFTNPQMRWGRLALINASGSERLDLTVPLRAEYWNGYAYVTNTADNCTVIENLAPDILLTNPDTAGGTPQPGNTAMIINDGSTQITSGPPAITAGVAAMTFSAPYDGDAIPDTGYVDIEVNLSVGGSDDPWLQYDWNGDGSFNDNPTGRASFGIYHGGDDLIYMREPWN